MLEFFPLNRSNQIKTFVGEIPFLGDFAVWLNNRLRGTLDTKPSYWISRVIASPDAQLVQIGSNDGRGGDPLNRLLKTRRKWKALFVEPVPHLFSRLRANYGTDRRFAFENAAINDGSKSTFYWVDEAAKIALPDLPDWYDQLGSFDRNHITRHIPELSRFILSEEINGLTLASLLRKHQIRQIEVLHIDTEGYDYKILSQLDLKTIRPAIILYEHLHLSPEEKAGAINFLKNDYELFQWGMDMFAVSKPIYQSQQASLRALDSFRVIHPQD